ncbi:Gp49 family protein [Acidovorax sp. BL-A-41-H1]|uniref:Gp49 family protein n=1 Tax=Acidovorax sp. BL-A-41-H1 TaxID=3421102 RepID=UPI003F7A26F0
MTDQAIEQEIQAKGLTAPRVTPADIEANIVGEHYFTAAEGVDGAARPVAYEFYNPDTGHAIVDYSEHTYVGHLSRAKGYVPLPLVKQSTVHQTPLGLLTFCVLVLRNGFTVTGESACASPENFDAEVGRKIARQNAVQKIWPLMGYELRSKLAHAASGQEGSAQ